MSLKEYRKKRNFKSTLEPVPKLAKRSLKRFVIQKHAASHLHYDLRLELGGALKSWAVPKGVPYKKGEKRLAMQVEDHPVTYIDFEGNIPKGEYGGGSVMVWDYGTYESLSRNASKDLRSGKLHFNLSGTKLRGEWYLVQLKKGKEWLLIKGSKDLKPITKIKDDQSAVSERSMKEIAAQASFSTSRPEKLQKALKRPDSQRSSKNFPKLIAPMKAKLVEQSPAGRWSYEVKFDGFRAMAFKKGKAVTLLSRNQKSLDSKFPEIVKAIANIKAETAIIDGEICALDDSGISRFSLLQNHGSGRDSVPLRYYAFDLLHMNGADFTSTPIEDRKSELKKLLIKSSNTIQYSASLDGKIEDLMEQARKLGLEGLIGKQKHSMYEPGRRSGSWIKLKLCHEQEFVIGGYSNPSGMRHGIGALLLGYYKGKNLHFSGKVGTGFTESLLRSLLLKFNKIGKKICPFVNLPEKHAGRFGSGVTASQMKNCNWLAPKLVCQVKFTEWTPEGKLRHPVFLGLRDDKAATKVSRETMGKHDSEKK